ncbi:MAG TPA: patatin-like phospholipase family protein [Acidimicrobiales bacterium]|nr:patatin-like phospholipase family protein [Acidimicrobiales bacterium]
MADRLGSARGGNGPGEGAGDWLVDEPGPDGLTEGGMRSDRLPGGVFMGPGGSRRWMLRHRRTGRMRRNVRTAFVFAGGGARGAAQVGMLQALVSRGIRPDAVYGTSVGAINAAGFAGEPTAAGVESMVGHWRRITREDVFPQGRFAPPWRFFQRREAVHSNTGLRGVIETGVPFERIEESAIHLEVNATSLTDGRLRWFTDGPAVDAILASSALPALLPPVMIDGEHFIDGGVVDNVPIGRAMEQGAQRIFVLLCGPMHYTPNLHQRPVEAVLTAFFIAVHARFAIELHDLPEGVEIVVFTVDTDPVSRYDDFSGTEALIAAGRRNAEAVLHFWESGGIGDHLEPRRLGPRPSPRSEPATVEEEAV